MRKQPSTRIRRDKEFTEHRSNHMRLESHDTSTAIPYLHEVRKAQTGVTTSDTEQPSKLHLETP
ncbi:hypothetical protein Taro_037683 [Colocasia esculenta]|uniref:Uncharacterized protein n=1 Tax=Colocasia esculenta TaxID=4460 RepID=A0A843W693_COLES|nr:hypothetical protein [Colocasia esculenta]